MNALLYLTPALLLLLALWLGRYPGEKAIWALKGATRSQRAGRAQPTVRRRAPTLPRGGLLLAASLAGRAPPRP